MREPIKKQLIQLVVLEAEATYNTENVTTDVNYDNVIGYRLYLSQLAAERKSTCQLKIDGWELEPEKYPVEGLICGTEVSPNERYKKVPFPIKAQGSVVRLTYTDGGAVTPPYTVTLALILSQDETAYK